jgi:hypothetical protein
MYTPSAPGITSNQFRSSFFFQEETVKINDKQNSIKRIGLIVTRVFFGINQGIDLRFYLPARSLYNCK